MQTKLNTSQLNYDVKTPENSFTSASETQAGIVERATDAEVLAGLDTTRFVTSKQVKDNILKYTFLKNITASENLIISSDTERAQLSNSLIKIKEIKLGDFLSSGTIRIKIDNKYIPTGSNAFMYFYKNGSQIGGTIAPTTNYITSILDASVVAGDLIQIYANAGTTSGVYVKNFRIYYTENIVDKNPYTILD